ncbi:MAG: cupin domain-containing protein [Candidatus Bathyarchaeia archaeon]|jgi:quercetin dioxygenase-like cupin family protein
MNKKDSSKLAAKASNLTGLIDYQEGSVVSRTIIDKKTGTVTLFAFDENQCLSEHTAPFEVLIYVIEGEVDLTISGKPLTLKQGEVTIVLTNEPHALAAKTKFKMLLTMIKT